MLRGEKTAMHTGMVLALLRELNIPYRYFTHSQMNTISDCANLKSEFSAQVLKNLLLRNSAGRHFYFYILDGNKKADLKNLSRTLAESRLSFATTDELMATLSVTPGNVTPFAIYNNKKKDLHVVIDSSVEDGRLLGFHPLINTASVCISKSDLLRLLAFYGYESADVQTEGMLRLMVPHRE